MILGGAALRAHLKITSEVQATRAPRLQEHTVVLAIRAEDLVLGPFLDALEVVVVTAYGHHVAFVLQADAALVVGDVEVHHLSIKGV